MLNHLKTAFSCLLLSILATPAICMDYSMQICNGKRTEHIADYTTRLSTDNRIALLLAVQNNNKAKVQELIAAGTNVNLEYTFNNPKQTTTPLAIAAGLGLTEVTELLLHANASLNGCSGNVPAIKFAAQNRHGKVMELLIKEGAKTNDWHSPAQITWIGSLLEKTVAILALSYGRIESKN